MMTALCSVGLCHTVGSTLVGILISVILLLFLFCQVMLKCDYRAEPADIWSCGIVLVAMLAGGMMINNDLHLSVGE